MSGSKTPVTPETPPSVDVVRSMLRGVVDPELNTDIITLGMVGSINVSIDGLVDIDVNLTIAGCPLRAQIRNDVLARIRSLPGVVDAKVHFGELSAEGRSAVMARARLNASRNAPATEISAQTRVLAIASGKGGVGKSSVTVNLAAALAARGLYVGVLDADIWGFSVPRMAGIDGRLGGSDGMIEPAERPVGTGVLKIVSMGLVVDDEDAAIMWRGLLLAKAVEEFLTKVRWGALDYLLIDMPPGTGDVQMALGRLLPQAVMLIVTTPALAAQKVAVRVADMARRGYLHVGGVIENMSWFEDPRGERHALFGTGGGERLGEEVGVELLARLPIAPDLSAGGDRGEPVALHAPHSLIGRDFAALAARVVADIMPPIDIEGCSARLLRALEAAVPASS